MSKHASRDKYNVKAHKSRQVQCKAHKPLETGWHRRRKIRGHPPTKENTSVVSPSSNPKNRPRIDQESTKNRQDSWSSGPLATVNSHGQQPLLQHIHQPFATNHMDVASCRDDPDHRSCVLQADIPTKKKPPKKIAVSVKPAMLKRSNHKQSTFC
ncbi:hypothetical protein BD289DRAFT_260898 [Coniella lustricola]|uniref:Uncharacterized protein n=1 Tax=Coniella lustricola TaxID=2025994 RepID=A0A2T3A7Q0_9PEZI|nr:hypothetical protein BD289DRAFT_260898 [Coniella lustricola]